jgi:peptidoglycan-associated lipoprotein
MKLIVLIATFLVALTSACHGGSRASTVPAPPPDFRKAYMRAPVSELAASTSNAPIPPEVAVYFDRASDRLPNEARDDLEAAARWLDRNPTSRLAVAGHADRAGAEDYNLTLSIRRARVVREYLVWLGADPRRIVSYAYGEHEVHATPTVSRLVLVYAIHADDLARSGRAPIN